MNFGPTCSLFRNVFYQLTPPDIFLPAPPFLMLGSLSALQSVTDRLFLEAEQTDYDDSSL